MKAKDKILEMQLEIAQIDVALTSKSDLALCMQQELVMREHLLRDAIDQLSVDDVLDAQAPTLH